MPVLATLYDAEGTDREVVPSRDMVAELGEQQLLWIDLSGTTPEEFQQIADLLALKKESVASLMQKNRRPRFDNYGTYFQININTVRQTDTPPKTRRRDDPNWGYRPVELDFLIGNNYVVTVHEHDIDFLESFNAQVKADSLLGRLDAPAFLATLLDWHITSFFRVIEALEMEVDRLDDIALRRHRDRDLLTDLIVLRRRVAQVRRALTPHREVYASLARPDFLILASSESADHFRTLNNRLENVIDAVENARELLNSAFDLFTTQTTLRTNGIIKILTLVSVVLLPAGVIINLLPMFSPLPLFNIGAVAFWTGMGAIVAISLLTFAVARYRRWI